MESDEEEEDEIVNVNWQAAGTRVNFKRDDEDSDDVDLIGLTDALRTKTDRSSSQDLGAENLTLTPSSSASRSSIERARDEAIVREVSRDLGCCDVGGRTGRNSPIAKNAASGAASAGGQRRPQGSFDDDDFCVIDDVGMT